MHWLLTNRSVCWLDSSSGSASSYILSSYLLYLTSLRPVCRAIRYRGHVFPHGEMVETGISQRGNRNKWFYLRWRLATHTRSFHTIFHQPKNITWTRPCAWKNTHGMGQYSLSIEKMGRKGESPYAGLGLSRWG